MKIDKYDLWGIISIIVSAMLLSLAMAIESNIVFVTFVMCMLFSTFCIHLVTYSIKLFNVYREEKVLNKFMDELVNCPDRVSPPRFKKGDWITDNTRVLQIQDVMERYDGTYYHIPYLVAMAKSYIYKATYIDKCFRLATPEELQQNGITIDGNE